MLNGNMYAYTYWIEIEMIVCHCLIIEWHLGCIWNKIHCMAWLLAICGHGVTIQPRMYVSHCLSSDDL